MVSEHALYKILFDQVGEGLLITGERGLIQLVNPRCLEMFGYDEGNELVGQPIHTLIPSRFHEDHVGHHGKYMKKPSDRPMGLGKVLMAQRKDGDEFPVEISLSSFKDENGDRKAIAIISDITERQKMQDALNAANSELEALVELRSDELRKSNLLYKSIARNFPNGSIYVFDKNLDYVFADGQALKRRGLSGDDLVGVNYGDMVLPDIADKVVPVLNEVFEGNDCTLEIEFKGTVFELLGVPLRDTNDRIDAILVVERDITKEKDIEKEIKASLERERELNNLKSRFVSIVSHEFRTPLAAIKSSAELIEKYTTTETNDKREKHTSRVQKSVDHLNGMIEDILSLSKIEEGKVEFKEEEFYVDEIVQELIDQNLEVRPNQKITFEKDHHLISSDRKLMTHVLQNLISNAFKYTVDDKPIEIGISETDTEIAVSVKDQGIGIPESEQKELFERFYRATNAQNIKGTGLGLNIVSKYIEYLKGTVRFTSEENVGSEFIVNFPKKPTL